MIEAVAPCRADLAGGTLDIWPLGLLHEGSVTVSAALDVRVVLRVDRAGPRGRVEHVVVGGHRRELAPADAAGDLTAAVVFALRPRGGVRVEVATQPPIGSGLGGSSAYGVALARAVGVLGSKTLDDRSTVSLVRDLEARVLGVPTGTQDHWAALRGGAMALHVEPGGERFESLPADADWLRPRMTVFFTGISHHSGMVNWEVMRRRLDRDADTTRAFGEIAEAATECREALVAGDSDGVAAAVRDEWSARKRLAPEVCPPELERLERAALEAGATAFKACGAGGGGSVVVWHEPDVGPTVCAALEGTMPRGRVLARGITTDGCTVRELPRDVDGSRS
jgi:D-glycero-alpha-D-manno-heptose-7-phosphate kinase